MSIRKRYYAGFGGCRQYNSSIGMVRCRKYNISSGRQGRSI